MSKKKLEAKTFLTMLLLANFIHLLPYNYQIIKEAKFDEPWYIVFWLLGVLISSLLIIISFYLIVNKKSNKMLTISLLTSYVFLLPIFFLNIDEIINSSFSRTLLMMGWSGMIRVWLSVILFFIVSGFFVKKGIFLIKKEAV